MGNAKRGLDIILEQSEFEIEKIIRHLADYNSRRQKLCNTIYAEVEAVVEKEKLHKNNIIIAANARWESGVLGIVSARITEKYGKPSIIFGINENVVKGSGRSIDGIDMVRVVSTCQDLCVSFGGHAMAAGLSVSQENFEQFRERITDFMNAEYRKINLQAEKLYDFELDIDDITPEFAREIEQLEPTGCDNPLPVFMTTVTGCIVGGLNNYPQHLRFSHKNMQFIFFGGADCGDVLAHNFPKRVVFEMQKLDVPSTTAIKAVAKGIVPVPIDPKSYALSLAGWLIGAFSFEHDIKFQNILNSLSCEREVFVEYYKHIKTGSGSRVYNAYDLFNKLDVGAVQDKYNLYQFVFCATVFKQLGILSFSEGVAKILEGHGSQLFESGAYNMIREREKVDVKIEKDIIA
jgi:hypothetical protein